MKQDPINDPPKTSPEGESLPRSTMEAWWSRHSMDMMPRWEIDPSQRIDHALKQMDKKEDMYRELVWFARNNPPKGIRLKRWKRIIAEYPEETAALECSGESDWTNGFNSGCLASFRYAARVLKGQITVWGEDWDTDFPELDTYDFDA